MSRLIAGCMTGTSIDALDAAVVEIEGTGLHMRARTRRCLTRPLGDLAAPLRRLADQEPMTAREIATLARDFALAHVQALTELTAGDKLDLICIHGQTVYHSPPVSWQLLNPAPIAHALKTPIVYDLRAADLAAGGQGAPITPIADAILFKHLQHGWAVVNLGGFCNVTLGPGVSTEIPDRELPITDFHDVLRFLQAADICACNQLLDSIARKLMAIPFDADGARAAAGEVNTEALEDLDGIFINLAGSRRSLGTGDEGSEWISRYRAHVSPEDLAATACEAIGEAIARTVNRAYRVFLAGGGVKNQALVRAISSCCSAKVELTDAHSVPAAYREAIAFAILGALCQDRVPITLPQVTGVPSPAPLSGAWVYP
jgi:anhydro-N-acetylmuramic acid kinase